MFMFGELWRPAQEFHWIFSSPAPFATTCNQKQGASRSPNQETRNAQQEKMMIDDNIWRGRWQQMKITCKILWKPVQVAITWAQADCNFQNLAGKNMFEAPTMKLTANSQDAPVCSLIVLLLSHKQCLRKNGSRISTYCGLLPLLAPRFPNNHFSEFNISQ